MKGPSFIFIRHGEAEHNAAFKRGEKDAFTGEKYKDAPLTDEGKKQATKTAEELVLKHGLNGFVAIWSSPLTRAIETALELFEMANVDEIILHDNLTELGVLGDVCNDRLKKRELKEKFPFCNSKYLPDYPAIWFTNEDKYSARQRIWMLTRLLLDMYKDEDAEKVVVIVAHHNIIQELTGKSLRNAEAIVFTAAELAEL